MKLECRIPGIVPQEPLLAFLRDALEQAARISGAPLAALGTVIVAGDEEYGPAIRSLDPEQTHTETADRMGAGKTLSTPRVNGVVGCDVVLRAFLFEEIAAAMQSGTDIATWDSTAQQAFYVLCHEMGHVRDFATRRDCSKVSDPRGKPFTVTETNHYYGDIAVSEFVACSHAAPGVPDTLFADFLRQKREELSAMKDAAELAWEQHTARPNFTVLSHTVTQTVWVPLTSLAQLHGHAHRHDSRRQAVLAWEGELAGSADLGPRFIEQWGQYPDWDPRVLREALSCAWAAVCAKAGYRPTTSTEGQDRLSRNGA
jgi:hypothetical protein